MNSGGQKGLESLAESLQAVRQAPPVHLWNPPYCGELDMHIKADGSWFYMGTPIGRPALVKLFASVLKKEDGRYFLVTPVEKIGIRVDDAPFLAVEMEVRGEGTNRSLIFRTNVDDVVECGPGHALRFEPEPEGGLRPYIHVRRDLWAKVTRALYFDLVSLGEIRAVEGRDLFGVTSAGEFFPMGPAELVKG
jgi:hypothetical protein